MTDLPDGYKVVVMAHQIDFAAGFSKPYFDADSASVAASASHTFTFYISNCAKVFQPSIITVGFSANQFLLAEVKINGETVAVKSSLGTVEINLKDNPAINLLCGDIIEVIATNLSSSTRTIFVHLNLIEIMKPTTYGRVPTAKYSFDKRVIDIGDTVAITDESVGTLTTWDYDFGDGSTHSTLQNPSHQYNMQGDFITTQIVGNTYGKDKYMLVPGVGVANREDLTTYVEVDPNSRITVAANQIDGAALDNSESAYVYYDFGSGNISGFDVAFKVNASVLDANGYLGLFRVSNDLGSSEVTTDRDYLLYIFEAVGDLGFNFCSRDSAGTEIASLQGELTLSSDFYIRLIRYYGTSYFRMFMYSDSGYNTNIYFGVNTDGANAYTTFRYMYFLTTRNISTAETATVQLNDLRIFVL